MSWHPHVTVATIAESKGKFLIVKELSEGEIVYNQPAGHLEPDETLIEAAKRETLEETGWVVDIQHLIGVQQYESPSNNITYIRFSFYARPVEQHKNRSLDDGIICAEWKSIEEMKKLSGQLRSPMVLADLEKHLAGTKFPLNLISTFSNKSSN